MDRPYTKLNLSTCAACGALLMDALLGTLMVSIFAIIFTICTLNLLKATQETHDDIDVLNYAISCAEQLKVMEINEAHCKVDDRITCSWYSMKSSYSYKGISPEFLIVRSTKQGPCPKSIELITTQ